MARRVVVTGLGAVSPFGLGVPALWAGLSAGASAIGPLTAFDSSEYGVQRAGEVPAFDPVALLGAPLAERLGRGAQLAVLAAREAWGQAGLAGAYAPEAVGVALGTTSGEFGEVEAVLRAAHQAGQEADLAGAWHPSLAKAAAHQGPAMVAADLGLGGPNALLPAACAAGNYALGHGFDLIRQGRVAAMLVGGSDALAEVTYAGFHKLNSMAPDVPRPFSADRQGMMVAEGSGVLVLESLEGAQARGATILAEVVGYGLSCDAHHITSPHPEARGAIAAMRAALAQAGQGPEAVGYVSAHGTGTEANDKVEALAMQALFGEGTRVPISSIKSMLGHAMGAASALEAIACVQALQEGLLPPTANHREADPACPVDCVPNAARPAPGLKLVLSNAYAFGGNNAVVALQAWGAA